MHERDVKLLNRIDEVNATVSELREVVTDLNGLVHKLAERVEGVDSSLAALNRIRGARPSAAATRATR